VQQQRRNPKSARAIQTHWTSESAQNWKMKGNQRFRLPTALLLNMLSLLAAKDGLVAFLGSSAPLIAAGKQRVAMLHN
jgi:hypothetical protein